VERKESQAGSIPQKSAELSPIETRQEIAKLAGVSRDTVDKVKAIEKKIQRMLREQIRRSRPDCKQLNIPEAFQLAESLWFDIDNSPFFEEEDFAAETIVDEAQKRGHESPDEFSESEPVEVERIIAESPAGEPAENQSRNGSGENGESQARPGQGQ
jgi:predicted RecB family nuclease